MSPELIGVGGVIAAVIVVAVVYYRKQDAKIDQETRRREAEQEHQRAIDAQLVADAMPLVDLPSTADLMAAGVRAQSLLARFDGLVTFQDVEQWDAEANEVAGLLDAEGRNIAEAAREAEAAIARYETSTSDPPDVKRARITKTRIGVRKAQEPIAKIPEVFNDLLERIDMTPNTKKEQQAVLKELRAAKKELVNAKKEVRAGMAEIRREARVAAANAGQVSVLFDWDGFDSRVAARERRAIRAAKEAAIAPHEDALAAVERQMLALDRRIDWVKRFGDADD